MAEECLNRERNTDHQLMSDSEPEEGTSAVKPAADVLQTSPPDCLTEAKTQTTDCRDPAVIEDLASADSLENNMNVLPQSAPQYEKGDPEKPDESIQSQLRPPNKTDTERQDRGDVSTAESKDKKALYHSVFCQMQQQQMHKPGRRFKKKTLMKMAKLFVIANGLDSEMMAVKYSNGPLAQHQTKELNHKEVTSQPNIDKVNSLKQETTFSGGQVKKRKRTSTNKKQKSGEDKACRSSRTEIWKEPEAPESLMLEPNLDDQNLHPDEDQTGQTSALTQVKTGHKETLPSQSSSSLSVNDDFDISSPSLSSSFCQASRNPSSKKRKTRSTNKKQATEQSKLSGATETDYSTSTNLLNKSQKELYSRGVTASKKSTLREISSVALKEDTKLTRDHSELSRRRTAEISSVVAPQKRAYKRRKKTKSGTKQKLLPQTFTEYNAVMQDVSEGFSVSCNEPPLASGQDTICNGTDLNAAKREHDESEILGITSEAVSSLQDEVSPVGTAPSDVPQVKRKRRRKTKTVWTSKKKLKRPQISNPAHVGTFSVSSDEIISLKLKDENDVKQRDAVQTMTANTKLKNYNPRRHELKSQKPLECSFCGRSFRHITAFTIHKRLHTGEKPYRCPTCGKRFSQLSPLKAHSKIHSEPHAVCCPCCDETFKDKDELIFHFQIHMKSIHSSKTTEDANNQQVGDCLDSPVAPGCNKPLRCNRETFKLHGRTHGRKLYSCSVCGKKFCKPSSLSFHEKTHWPVKPYSCSVCFKGFAKLRELKRHSQTHSGDLSFSCGRCENTFSSFELLRSHEVFEVCPEKQDGTCGNQSDVDGFLVSKSVEGQIVTPVYFKCSICKQLHRHWCQYVLHLQTHTQSEANCCETCGQQYIHTTGSRSHCMVCCRKSGEDRACRSSLTEIWKEPEAPESQKLEPNLDGQSLPLNEDQTGQTTALPQVETGDKEVTDVQSQPPSPSSSSLSVNDDVESSFCPTSDQTSRKPNRVHLQSLILRHCGRYSHGRCGKSFSRWSKLWLDQRFHQQTGRPSFSCSRCDLEFCFLASYIDHLREHAAQTPYACPLCPDTFTNEENLSTHISDFHKQGDFKKCSICSKNFSTLRNLKKHKLLHKGTTSHFCLACNLSFCSNSALKTHLRTHKTRLNVPKPAGFIEPLLFPYQCGKCPAKFSSTDLLQAHQVCHFIAGRKPESPPESVASCITSRAVEEANEVISGTSQRKRRFPVSNKKNLFRYPHPDLLYVVPVVSSEPPVVISDTEEKAQVQSSSNTTSTSNTGSHIPQPGAILNSSDPSVSNIPQSSTVSTLRDVDEHETGPQDYSDGSLVLPELHQDQDSCSDSLESLLWFPEDTELVDDVHECAICMQTFIDISKLREHYMDHARGT